VKPESRALSWTEHLAAAAQRFRDDPVAARAESSARTQELDRIIEADVRIGWNRQLERRASRVAHLCVRRVGPRPRARRSTCTRRSGSRRRARSRSDPDLDPPSARKARVSSEVTPA
jgi:hypothetical protein